VLSTPEASSLSNWVILWALKPPLPNAFITFGPNLTASAAHTIIAPGILAEKAAVATAPRTPRILVPIAPRPMLVKPRPRSQELFLIPNKPVPCINWCKNSPTFLSSISSADKSTCSYSAAILFNSSVLPLAACLAKSIRCWRQYFSTLCEIRPGSFDLTVLNNFSAFATVVCICCFVALSLVIKFWSGAKDVVSSSLMILSMDFIESFKHLTVFSFIWSDVISFIWAIIFLLLVGRA